MIELNSNIETKRFELKERTKKHLQYLLSLDEERLINTLNLSNKDELSNEVNRIKRLLRRDKDEYLLWDVIDKKEKKIIANLGFHNKIDEHQKSEIGYWCNESWRRKGVIYESLTAIIDFGFNTLNLNRIEAFLDTDNIASEGLLKKLNFTHEGLLREHYIFNGKVCDSLVYGLLKKDYLSSK